MYFTVNRDEGSTGIGNHIYTIKADNTFELSVALKKGLEEHFDAIITDLPDIDIESVLYGKELSFDITADCEEGVYGYSVIINETWLY